MMAYLQRSLSLTLRTAILAALVTLVVGKSHAEGGATFAAGGDTLPRHKEGFVQLWETEAGYFGGGDQLGITEVSTMMRVAVPLTGRHNILAFQPLVRSFLLDGPEVVDVPEELICAQLNILWRWDIAKRWQTTVWAQPKHRSDLETSKDSFFFSGGGFVRYTWKPGKFDLYMGALFLDREDISFLPGFGFIWTPTSDWRVEALLPRPKIAKRISTHGSFSESWVYLSGQLGGGSFAVARDDGTDDKVTLRDLRLFLGAERVVRGGGGVFAEAGFVFDRTVEYTKSVEEFTFDDSLMVRLGYRY